MPAEQAIHLTTEARHRLPRVFRTPHLVMLGLGVMIGAGIFGLAGAEAASTAGPAVILSFVVAALVCLLAAFSFAELSSTIPAAGSVYTFSYVAIGELWAWVVGWALILELVVAAALVARVWASYLVATVDGFDVDASRLAAGTLPGRPGRQLGGVRRHRGADRTGGHRHQALRPGARGRGHRQGRGDRVRDRGRIEATSTPTTTSRSSRSTRPPRWAAARRCSRSSSGPRAASVSWASSAPPL